MTNILTETNRLNILAHIQKTFNRSQANGLNCLIFLALREQTTIAYQRKEWGFDDIPEQIIPWIDELDEDDLLALAADIATGLLEELTVQSSKKAIAESDRQMNMDLILKEILAMTDHINKPYVERYINRANATDSETEKNNCLYRAATQMEIIDCDGDDNLTPAEQQTVLDAAQKLLGR